MRTDRDADTRLTDLVAAFRGLGGLLIDKKDMHLVDPNNFEALLDILADELDAARIAAADELAEVRAKNRTAA